MAILPSIISMSLLSLLIPDCSCIRSSSRLTLLFKIFVLSFLKSVYFCFKSAISLSKSFIFLLFSLAPSSIAFSLCSTFVLHSLSSCSISLLIFSNSLSISAFLAVFSSWALVLLSMSC